MLYWLHARRASRHSATAKSGGSGTDMADLALITLNSQMPPRVLLLNGTERDSAKRDRTQLGGG